MNPPRLGSSHPNYLPTSKFFNFSGHQTNHINVGIPLCSRPSYLVYDKRHEVTVNGVALPQIIIDILLFQSVLSDIKSQESSFQNQGNVFIGKFVLELQSAWIKLKNNSTIYSDINEYFSYHSPSICQALREGRFVAEQAIFHYVQHMCLILGMDLPTACLLIATMLAAVPNLEPVSASNAQSSCQKLVEQGYYMDEYAVVNLAMPQSVEIDLRTRAYLLNPGLRTDPIWRTCAQYQISTKSLVNDILFLLLVQKSISCDEKRFYDNIEDIFCEILKRHHPRYDPDLNQSYDPDDFQANIEAKIRTDRRIIVETAAHFLSNDEIQENVRKIVLLVFAKKVDFLAQNNTTLDDLIDHCIANRSVLFTQELSSEFDIGSDLMNAVTILVNMAKKYD